MSTYNTILGWLSQSGPNYKRLSRNIYSSQERILTTSSSKAPKQKSIPEPRKEPPKFHALVIGIDKYAATAAGNPNFKDLEAAVADAKAFKYYLNNHLSVPDSQIKTLYDSEATREAIIEGIKTLMLERNGIEPSSSIVIYYAGHGGEKKKPKDWQSDSDKIQMIIPHDFGNPQTAKGGTVQGIPDRTLNALLEQLAKVKGDNITVIFDCCHSGSATRETVPSNDGHRSRGVIIDDDVPEDLDVNIWDPTGEKTKFGPRLSEISSGFLYKGLRSHVLLAACGATETAKETIHGVFTDALLRALKATEGKISYSDLILRLPSLPQQTPQCEGLRKERLLWHSRAVDTGIHPYDVHIKKNDEGENVYILEAGIAHGITDGAEFAIYPSTDHSYAGPSLGTFVVASTEIITSTLVVQGEPGIPTTAVVWEGQAPALLLRAGAEADLRLHVADSKLEPLLTDIIEKYAKGSNRLMVSIVEKEMARLAISLKENLIDFELLNPLVTQFGLTRMPYRVIDERLPSVIQAAAHFDWHLRRDVQHPANDSAENSANLDKLRDSVHLEFTKVVHTKGKMQVEGDNLNIGGRIDVVVDDHTYGIKLVNNSEWELYPYLFFFDCSDLSIEYYYDSPMAHQSKKNAPLQPKGGFLTIGYGSGGWSPWRYRLREASSIEGGRVVQDAQDVDVGFLKLFLSTKPVKLSRMVQDSPFIPPYKPPLPREGNKMSYEAIGVWDTRLITVIQRRKAPEVDTNERT